MSFKKFFLIFFFIISISICTFAISHSACNGQIEKLNKEIKDLEDARRGLSSAATKFENQAQRLQFESNQMIDAKRYWRLAEEYREKVKELDQTINEKKLKRDALLKECE